SLIENDGISKEVESKQTNNFCCFMKIPLF
ncbi:hypothetical protein ACUXAL_002898, partial [Staphylococcus saprophyticus]